jgi:hypothetical protein
MKKIELIWREILETGVKNPVFEQKKLAQKFHFSTSTVFAAVSPLRHIGAVTVTGRNFRITNLEKILLYWATHRQLNKDIIYQTHVDAPVLEIEGLMPPHTIYGAYCAARRLLADAPADYEMVYVYASDALAIQKRFPPSKQSPNLFVLAADPYVAAFGPVTPPSQTFVDLWNLPHWYAKDFLDAVKEKFYGFL